MPEGCQKLVKAPFIHQLNTDSLEGHEIPLLSEGGNHDNKIPSKVGKRVEKGTLSKSKPMAHSDILLATRLIQSSLDVLQKASNQNRSRHLGRFKLWANEYGTPHGQLDKILKESPILKEATVTLLADLCNILTTGTSHLDGNYPVLTSLNIVLPILIFVPFHLRYPAQRTLLSSPRRVHNIPGNQPVIP